jgi:uncharacterized membrane protein YccC
MPSHFSVAVSLRSSTFASLQRWLLSFPLRHASLSEGLRAASGAGTMLLLGEWLHNPLFSWAAVGAFLTCLADSAGSNRARLASMGGFSVASSIAGLFAATLAGAGLPEGLLAIMLCAGVAGFARIYGAAVGLVLALSAGMSAVLGDFPIVWWPLHQSHILVYFSGCAWATLLGLTVWRIHPFAPARDGVARVYDTLAELARLAGKNSHAHPVHEETAAATRRHARVDITNAHAALMRIPADRADTRQLYENLLIKLARADSLLNCITVLSDLHLANYLPPPARMRIGRVLDGMALLLQEIARSISAANVNADSHAQDARAVLRLRQLIGRIPTQAAQLLQLPELTLEGSSADHLHLLADWKRSARPASTPPGWSQRLRDEWRNASAHLLSGSAETRHALRCAAATGLTYLLVHWLDLPFGYWATMATILVLQPSIADSWKRSMERGIGSVLGSLLAVLLCLFIHSPLLLALLVFPMAGLSMGLRPVSYGLYSMFLTPMMVLVTDVSSDPQQQLSNALLRAGTNLIGVVIALIASYLLWPRRQPANLHQQLSQMIVTNLAYLDSALQAATPTQLHAQRRAACVINNETGLLLQRLRRELDMDDQQGHKARISLALSRRLTAAATHIWLHPQQQSAHPGGANGHPAEGKNQLSSENQRRDSELRHWLEHINALFGRAMTVNAGYATLLRQRPEQHDLARADAVETLCLLVVAMYPELASKESSTS